MPGDDPRAPHTDLVKEIGESVSPNEVDALLHAHDRSYSIRAIVDAWARQQQEDRNLRRYYANWLVGIITAQLAIIYLVLFLIGFGFLDLDSQTVNVFVVGVFGETAVLGYIVCRYLFSDSSKGTSDILQRFLGERLD